jgi:hypothetical protein
VFVSNPNVAKLALGAAAAYTIHPMRIKIKAHRGQPYMIHLIGLLTPYFNAILSLLLFFDFKIHHT